MDRTETRETHARADRSFLVLVNPISGRGRGVRLAGLLPELFARRGSRAEVILLDRPGAIADLVTRRGGDFGAVVAVGGDGTIAQAAGAAHRAGIDQPLGLIPLGLSNCLARHLNLPLNDVESAVDVLTGGRLRKVGLALVPEGVSLSFLGAGFDADVVRRVARARKGAIQNGLYIRSAFRTLADPGRPFLRVVVDGRPLPGVFIQAILSAVTNYAHYFRMAERPGFHLYLFRGSRTWGPIRAAARSLAFRSLDRGADLVVPVRETLRIESDGPGGGYQFDGEAGGSLPLECEVRPEALDFLAP